MDAEQPQLCVSIEYARGLRSFKQTKFICTNAIVDDVVDFMHIVVRKCVNIYVCVICANMRCDNESTIYVGVCLHWILCGPHPGCVCVCVWVSACIWGGLMCFVADRVVGLQRATALRTQLLIGSLSYIYVRPHSLCVCVCASFWLANPHAFTKGGWRHGIYRSSPQVCNVVVPRARIMSSPQSRQLDAFCMHFPHTYTTYEHCISSCTVCVCLCVCVPVGRFLIRNRATLNRSALQRI